MRSGTAVSVLVLFYCLPGAAQTQPAGWTLIRDAKGACQVAVPPEWTAFGEKNGAAVLQDAGTAIAVVTNQPGQAFKPFSPAILKTLNVPKEKMFENSATRIFYQDRAANNTGETSAFSSSVPYKGGTCSVHVVFVQSVPEETARKIALSLEAADKT